MERELAKVEKDMVWVKMTQSEWATQLMSYAWLTRWMDYTVIIKKQPVIRSAY